MRRVTSVFVATAASLLIIAAIAAAALYAIVRKSLPEDQSTERVPGLGTRAEIMWDGHGIPHVMAGSSRDIAVAAGWIHARDRLWQMDLLRRFGRGRLSEIFGSRALSADRLMRTIGIGRLADTLYLQVSNETRAIATAYAEGVNAFLREHEGKYPLEFDILQYKPEPWRPQDCIVVMRVVAWELSLAWWTDLMFGDLVQTLGIDRARQLIPDDAVSKTTILPPPLLYRPDPLRAFRDAALSANALLGRDGSSTGSNCWAVTGLRSTTGLPLLANDTHLLFGQPAFWYVAHFSAPGINVAGMTLPGVPGVLIGHNDRIAWGVTNAMADDADFSVEHVSLGDSTYEYRGGTRRLGIRVDSIAVRDSATVEFTVYSTLHGPVINGVHPALMKALGPLGEPAVTVRWTGFEATDELLAISRLDRAASVADFREALRSWGMPAQNVTYADRNGVIGYMLAGLLPIRSDAAMTLPSRGWDGSGEWQGWIPFDRLPSAFAPEGNVIASANNRISATLPYPITHLWESDARIDRIHQMLQERSRCSQSDIRLMQMDITALAAGPVRDAFVAALRDMPGRSLDLTRAMNLLAAWDLRMTPRSPAAALYNTAWVHLVRETFADELGMPLFTQYVHLSNIPFRVLPRLLADTSTTWFDNVRTARVETRDDILRKSAMLALLELTRRFGPDMTSWRWGDMHTVTFRHPLGVQPPLDRLFNVGPFPVGGNSSTVNSSEYSLATPYDAIVGPAMRMIVDLASPDSSLVVLTSGQSGQALSPHYSDQSVLWLNGAYHLLLSNVATIRRLGWPTTVLTP